LTQEEVVVESVDASTAEWDTKADDNGKDALALDHM